MNKRVVLAALLLAALAGGQAAAAGSPGVRRTPLLESTKGGILAVHDGLDDVDARGARLAPTAAALAAARRLPAGVTVRWNDWGTPATVINHSGWVDSGLRGTPAAAARGWIRAHRDLFRLSDADVTNLELVNDAPFTHAEQAHAVLFRQRFGSLMSAQDGLIAVGLREGQVAIVTSSAVGSGAVAAAPRLSAAEAWLRAARDAGRTGLALDQVVAKGVEHTGFTLLKVPGFLQPQRARLVALATRGAGVRPVFETIVLDVDGASGHAEAYTSFVDAVSGKVWMRLNRVQTLDDGWTDASSLTGAAGLLAPTYGTFTGSYSGTPSADKCGPLHKFNAPAGSTAILLYANQVIMTNDLVLNLVYRGKTIVSVDPTLSPEVIVYNPPGGVPSGQYAAQVCPQGNSINPAQTEPYDYHGAWVVYDGEVPGVGAPYPAKWAMFTNNPRIEKSKLDNRIIACWDSRMSPSTTKDVKSCKLDVSNLGARLPWDVHPRTLLPTFTTIGNAAITGQAWLSPLTPAEPYRPVSPTRDYIFPWTNHWRTSKQPTQTVDGCAPNAFLEPQRVDTDNAVGSLFAQHNRMHNFTYALGYTERNFNHQISNFGATGAQYENDPQVGNAQAGALNGGAPSYLGRDNANQITLNDGISPISNMYLWQPIGGAFYADCVDGDYDASIIGHEYTHAVSNRMVAGPDAGLSGEQAGSMGESWSDLTAIEYLAAYGYAGATGEDPASVGAYATNNKVEGIRDYNLDRNPLNYSDFGFDTTGPEVHADGEIWNAISWNVRRRLIDKYNKQYPYRDRALQVRCARGILPADKCPGNRRWIQNQFDAWLLMPSGVSFIDSRDAMLAADRLRTRGANQAAMWAGFAQTGMGIGAESLGSNDTDPEPSFVSPVTKPAAVTFKLVDAAGKPVAGEVFVGRYEARAYPVADTLKGTSDIPASTRLAAGTYELFIRANGFGHKRLLAAYASGRTYTSTIRLARNLASVTNGALARGDGIYHRDLIDDTEATDWLWSSVPADLAAGNGVYDPREEADRRPVRNRAVTVDLAGGVQTIQHFNVSAMHRPQRAGEDDDPPQFRFSALRQFAIDVSTDGRTFKRVYVSSPDFFPSRTPRPVVPTINLRSFSLSKPVRASHVRLVVLTNQCTGNPAWKGDREADPASDSDCLKSYQANQVQVAELQVFGPGARPAGAPRGVAATGVAGATVVGAVADHSANVATAPLARLDAAPVATSEALPFGVGLLAVVTLVGASAAVRRFRSR